jgi:hypothetical protein
MIIVVAYMEHFSCLIKSESDRLTAISLKQETPIVNRDSSVTIIGGTYNIYYYNELLMYRLNYRFDSIVNGQSVFQETRSFYFASHKDSAYGYKYMVKPDKSNTDNVRYKKDSLLRFYSFESNVYDTLINFKPDSIYKQEDGIVKVYKNPPSGHSADQPEKFDLYFYYTKKLKDIPETFSRKMDNEKGMKLIKIVVKASGGFYKEFNATFQPREHLLEMTEIPIGNRNEVMHYLRRYQQQKI